MPSMPAGLWRRLQAVAPAGKRILGKPGQLQTVRPPPSLQRGRTCFTPRIPQCPCVIRNVRAAVARLVAAERVGVPVGAAQVEEPAVGREVAQGVVGAEPEEAQEEQAAVRAAPAE